MEYPKTEILSIDEESLAKASRLVRNGELVAFPTETVYGLGANALDSTAVSRIFEAKGRPSDNPLIVHVWSKRQIPELTRDYSPLARALVKAFFPAPMTLVVKKSSLVPDIVTAGGDTVGIRMPRSLPARRFLKACGVPVAAPSANTSGRPSPTTAKSVFEDMQGRIPLILDGGDCDVGIESTVINACGSIPYILRPGIITESNIDRALSDCGYYASLDADGGVFEDTDPRCKTATDGGKVAMSPGTRHRHYAPKVPVFLFERGERKLLSKLQSREELAGKRILLLCFDDTADRYPGMLSLKLGKDYVDASRRLFEELREAEKECDFILLEKPENAPEASGVLNRMLRAGGNNLI